MALRTHINLCNRNNEAVKVIVQGQSGHEYTLLVCCCNRQCAKVNSHSLDLANTQCNYSAVTRCLEIGF